MKIEFLDDRRLRAKITKGWLTKTVAVVVAEPYSASTKYPQIGHRWVYMRWQYEGTEINCSDDVTISKYRAKLERRDEVARDRRDRDTERAREQATKQVEKDHLRSLREPIPQARLLKP